VSSAAKHYLISILTTANNILSKNKKPTQVYKNKTCSPEIYAHLPSPLPTTSLLCASPLFFDPFFLVIYLI